MQKTKKVQINGENYELIEMPATRRSIIGLQIKHIVAGSKEGIKDVKDFDSDIDIDYAQIVFGILDRIEPEKGAYLLRDIIMNGLRFPVMETADDYDVHFASRYDDQIDLVAEIMEFNFGGVIENIKKKLTSIGLLSLISSKTKEITEELKNTN